MSFNQIETSDYYATASFLYEFQIDGNTWRYTAADSDLAAAGAVWERASIEHDRVSQSGDADQDNVVLTLPENLIPVLAYIGSAPSQQMMVRFRKAHDGEEAAPVYWVGLVSSVDWPAPGRATFSLIPLSATVRREGLSMTYQRGCRHALYGQGRGKCNVNRDSFRVPGTIIDISANVVLIAGLEGFPPGWFNGGFLEWVDDIRGREWRTIEAHDGTPAVRLFGLSDGLAIGMKVNAFAGCARTMQMCDEKFNNVDNYGGQPHLPGDSPFDGDPFD